MKRLITAVLVSLALLAPATASADISPTNDYCEFSLRGGGSLAPDNDIRRVWDQIEADFGYNLVVSHPGNWFGFTGYGDHSALTWWVFERQNGQTISVLMSCWWEPLSNTEHNHADEVYHDDDSY